MVLLTVRMPESAASSKIHDGELPHEGARKPPEADDLHAEEAVRGLADGADGGVQAGAVAAGSHTRRCVFSYWSANGCPTK